MTKRTKFSKLAATAVMFREPVCSTNEIERNAYHRNDLIIVDLAGEIVATVSRDDVFDSNGNRFAY